jgi:hypothetical protein
MTNHMDTLKLSTIKEIFPDELMYLRQHRWDFVERNFTYLSLLNNDQLSTWHLEQIKNQINAERAAIAKKLEDEQKGAGKV